MAPFSNYDPQTRQLLYDAFDAAWLEMDYFSLALASHAELKSRLTRALLDAAEAGERDPREVTASGP
jgi:hypothetical protein